MSRNGVHCVLCLPVNIVATSLAIWLTVWPAASTMYHFLFPARSLPLGKYVDIVNYLYFKRLERERLEYRSLLSIVKPAILDICVREVVFVEARQLNLGGSFFPGSPAGQPGWGAFMARTKAHEIIVRRVPTIEKLAKYSAVATQRNRLIAELTQP